MSAPKLIMRSARQKIELNLKTQFNIQKRVVMLMAFESPLCIPEHINVSTSRLEKMEPMLKPKCTLNSKTHRNLKESLMPEETDAGAPSCSGQEDT